jgi:hypothetical protein
MKRQRGSSLISIFMIVGLFALLAGAFFSFVFPQISHAKNSMSLASQARLVSIALTDDYLHKCSIGTVSQATWNDLAVQGLALADVSYISKYILSWKVVDDESPKGEISFSLSDSDAYGLMRNLQPGVKVGSVYKWYWNINDDISNPNYGYEKLFGKRCGR